MRRNKPLRRRAALRRSQTQLQRRKRWPEPTANAASVAAGESPPSALTARKPIKPVSKKRQRENRKRTAVLKAMREADPMCRRCRKQRAVDGHELLRRSARGSITDPANIRLLCRPCHEWVGANPKQAIADGWAISRHEAAMLQAIAGWQAGRRE